MNRKLFTIGFAHFIVMFVMAQTADAQNKITGPWLWMIAPTKSGQGGANSTDIDSLAEASGGYVTEEMIANNGANAGDAVGDLVWTLGKISETGGNNVNNLINEIGLGKGDVNDHSSYALITLESDSDQDGVDMRVGSDDSVKVWLNGEEVHNNPVNRGAGDFQDTFLVDIKQGDNLLLVKISERGGGWSMFVGVDADVNAVFKPAIAGMLTAAMEGTSGASVHIPDSNLRVAITAALGKAPDALITAKEMSTLKSLQASSMKIQDLEGLQFAEQLRTLSLVGNNISDISPLTGLTQLRGLLLSNNNISDISPLTGLTQLRGLFLGRNNISDISPLAGFTQLRSLYLENNNISDLSPLTELTQLYDLSLVGNNISDISLLAKLTQLGTLQLRENNISDLSPLAELTQLEILYLDGNNISDISPLAKLTHLKWLYLQDNNISDASPLAELTQLEILHLDGNNISDVLPPANGDINRDGQVSVLDMILVARHLGETASANSAVDVNGDGVVSILDLVFVAQRLGESSAMAAPSVVALENIEGLDAAVIASWIAQAWIEDNGSFAFRQGIAYLESLLASVIPEETALLPNYPNPSNPETWIPYHLANPSDVRITIYDARGTIIRHLDLGHQREGYYTSRNRAAYWDGRNAVGERVASGVYFYQLQADDLLSLRKMVILK